MADAGVPEVLPSSGYSSICLGSPQNAPACVTLSCVCPSMAGGVGVIVVTVMDDGRIIIQTVVIRRSEPCESGAVVP